MPDHLVEFESALAGVPLVLLGTDDARVVTDAATAAEVLGTLSTVGPPCVVLVGCTGVGKSYLVSCLAGSDVSKASVIRPTTVSVVTAHLSGVVLVDTPAWGLEVSEIEAALADAELGVLVVSPSRYADAATLAAWKTLEASPQTLVVLNRQRGTSDERAAVLASVEERFDGAPVVVVEESGDTHQLRDEILGRISSRSATDARRGIALTTARHGAQHIARALTAAARDLSRLSDVVESVTTPGIGQQSLSVRENWNETAQEVIDAIERLLNDLDLEVVEQFGGNLSSRMLSDMARWQRSDTEAALAAWRVDTALRFQGVATTRWRRSDTKQMIDDISWKVGVNPSVVVSKRVGRVVGTQLEALSVETHEMLIEIADAAIEGRIGEWQRCIDEAGSFKPGELLAAADSLDSR